MPFKCCTQYINKILESPLDSKEMKSVNPKGNQPWIFTGRTDPQAEASIPCPLDVKTWLIGKGLNVGKVQFSSVAQSCPTLCDPMDCSMPGLPVHHQLSEFTQTQVHWVGDAIQPSHSLSSPSAPTFNLSQHQGLFQGVSSSHQVAKVLEF